MLDNFTQRRNKLYLYLFREAFRIDKEVFAVRIKVDDKVFLLFWRKVLLGWDFVVSKLVFLFYIVVEIIYWLLGIINFVLLTVQFKYLFDFLIYNCKSNIYNLNIVIIFQDLLFFFINYIIIRTINFLLPAYYIHQHVRIIKKI